MIQMLGHLHWTLANMKQTPQRARVVKMATLRKMFERRAALVRSVMSYTRHRSRVERICIEESSGRTMRAIEATSPGRCRVRLEAYRKGERTEVKIPYRHCARPSVLPLVNQWSAWPANSQPGHFVRCIAAQHSAERLSSTHGFARTRHSAVCELSTICSQARAIKR